jgi:hypothetical protein
MNQYDPYHRLVAFRHLKGSHTGEHLADVFFRVLQELSVLDRVSFPWLKSQYSTLLFGFRWG